MNSKGWDKYVDYQSGDCVLYCIGEEVMVMNLEDGVNIGLSEWCYISEGDKGMVMNSGGWGEYGHCRSGIVLVKEIW